MSKRRPTRPSSPVLSPRKSAPPPQNLPSQGMKEPSVMSSVKHGVASGFGIGAGIEGARQVGSALFGEGNSQEKDNDVPKDNTCNILRNVYNETCVNTFDECSEKCKEMYNKFNEICEKFNTKDF